MTARSEITQQKRIAVTIPIVWNSASIARGAGNTQRTVRRSKVYGRGGYHLSTLTMKASSSIGRAFVSKTNGCGFKSCLACMKATPLIEGGVLAVRNKKEFNLG
jgi:hypothetical protein